MLRMFAIVVAAMFAVTTALVLVASATNSTVPFFAMFVPLLIVPWALTRPVPGEAMPPPAGADAESAEEPEEGPEEESEEGPVEAEGVDPEGSPDPAGEPGG